MTAFLTGQVSCARWAGLVIQSIMDGHLLSLSRLGKHETLGLTNHVRRHHHLYVVKKAPSWRIGK